MMLVGLRGKISILGGITCGIINGKLCSIGELGGLTIGKLCSTGWMMSFFEGLNVECRHGIHRVFDQEICRHRLFRGVGDQHGDGRLRSRPR
jgi:hypothetical protein